MTKDFAKVADNQMIEQAVKALAENGMTAIVVNNKEAAKDAVIRLIPKGSNVFTVTSETLRLSGITETLNSEGYDSVRNKFMALVGKPEKQTQMKQITSVPDYVVGSVHALTLDGRLMIASATGSQMPAEAYGANHVVFVVGAQKLVKDITEGLERINEHTVPLEDERALKAYGAHTSFSKLLILNKDRAERTTVIIIKETIGF